MVGQILATDPQIGYLLLDIAEDASRRVGEDLCERMGALSTTISARLLY